MVNSGSFDAHGTEGELVKAEFTQLDEDTVPRSAESPHHLVGASATEANFTAVVPDAETRCSNLGENLPLVERDDGLKDSITTTTAYLDLQQHYSDKNLDECCNTTNCCDTETKTSLQCSVPLDKVKNVLEICKQQQQNPDKSKKISSFYILENYLKNSLNTSETIQMNELSTNTAADTTTTLDIVTESSPKPTMKRLLCLFCERTFSSNNLKQKHVDRCHSAGQSRRFSSRIPTPNQSATACCFCSKLNQTNHTLSQLLEHLISEHSNRYYACLACQERFTSLQSLKEHNGFIHGEIENKTTTTTGSREKPADCLRTESATNDKYESSTTTTTKFNLPAKNIVSEQIIQNNIEIDFEDSIRTNIISPVRKEEETESLSNRKIKTVSNAKIKKKLSVKSTKNGLRTGLRTTRSTVKQMNNFNNNAAKTSSGGDTREKIVSKKPPSNPTSVFSLVNAYTYKYEKIYDHSSDSIKDASSVQFNATFDKDFYIKTVCNIRENLLNHLDGKLNNDIESENRISNFEHNPNCLPESEVKSENFGCDISLNAVTPVATLLVSSQYGEDFDSQIEYGAKASQKKPKKVNVVKYKFPNKKYNSLFREKDCHSDMTCLDMWTQLTVKERQQKVHDYDSCDNETSFIHPTNKEQVEELNRILDKRGPFEDLRLEADAANFFELRKKSKDNENLSDESSNEVYLILEDILTQVMNKCDEDLKKENLDDDIKPNILSVQTTEPNQNLEIPNYLKLQKGACKPNPIDVDPTDKIALICTSLDEDSHPNEELELSGEWARPRIYICATCGLKLPNLKALDDHKTFTHPNIWSTHYEFVGNQSQFYRHLSIPCLGKVGLVECSAVNKVWQRSDARVCTKCKKQCHSLGDLHRHMLECGGDWTWMLARKKCKYRPYGARSRRRRQRGYKRSCNPEVPREPRKYKAKTNFIGPRPKPSKPSDAETIERMLANLPAKRNRKVISMRDGIQGPRKQYKPRRVVSPSTQNSPSENNPSNGGAGSGGKPKKVHFNSNTQSTKQTLRNALKRKVQNLNTNNQTQLKLRTRANRNVNNIVNNEQNADETTTKENTTQQNIGNNKNKLRNTRMISRILGSKIFDSNSALVTRRRLVKAITQNSLVRKTRLRTKMLESTHLTTSSDLEKTDDHLVEQTIKNKTDNNIKKGRSSLRIQNDKTVKNNGEIGVKINESFKTKSVFKSNKKTKIDDKKEIIEETTKIDTISKVIEEVVNMGSKFETEKFKTTNRTIRKTRSSEKFNYCETSVTEENIIEEKPKDNKKKVGNIIERKTNKLLKSIKALGKNKKINSTKDKDKSLTSKLLRTLSIRGSKQKKTTKNGNIINNETNLNQIEIVISEVVERSETQIKNKIKDACDANIKSKDEEEIEKFAEPTTNQTVYALEKFENYALNTLKITENNDINIEPDNNILKEILTTVEITKNICCETTESEVTQTMCILEKSDGVNIEEIEDEAKQILTNLEKKEETSNQPLEKFESPESKPIMNIEKNICEKTSDTKDRSENSLNYSNESTKLEILEPLNNLDKLPTENLGILEKTPFNISDDKETIVEYKVTENSVTEFDTTEQINMNKPNNACIENKRLISESKPCDDKSHSTLSKFKSKMKRSGRGLNDCIAMLKCKLEQKHKEPSKVDKSNLFIINSLEANQPATTIKENEITENIPEINNSDETIIETPKVTDKIDKSNILEIPTVNRNTKLIETNKMPPTSDDSITQYTELSSVLNATLKNCLMQCVQNKCDELKIKKDTHLQHLTTATRKIGSIRKRKEPILITSNLTDNHHSHIPNIPVLLNTAFIETTHTIVTPLRIKEDSSDEDIPLSKLVTVPNPPRELNVKIPVAKKKRKPKKNEVIPQQNECVPQAISVEENIEQHISLDNSINNRIELIQAEIAIVKENKTEKVTNSYEETKEITPLEQEIKENTPVEPEHIDEDIKQQEPIVETEENSEEQPTTSIPTSESKSEEKFPDISVKDIVDTLNPPLSQQIMNVEEEPCDSYLLNKTLTETNITNGNLKNFTTPSNHIDSGKENSETKSHYQKGRKRKPGRKPKIQKIRTKLIVAQLENQESLDKIDSNPVTPSIIPEELTNIDQFTSKTDEDDSNPFQAITDEPFKIKLGRRKTNRKNQRTKIIITQLENIELPESNPLITESVAQITDTENQLTNSNLSDNLQTNLDNNIKDSSPNLSELINNKGIPNKKSRNRKKSKSIIATDSEELSNDKTIEAITKTSQELELYIDELLLKNDKILNVSIDQNGGEIVAEEIKDRRKSRTLLPEITNDQTNLENNDSLLNNIESNLLNDPFIDNKPKRSRIPRINSASSKNFDFSYLDTSNSNSFDLNTLTPTPDLNDLTVDNKKTKKRRNSRKTKKLNSLNESVLNISQDINLELSNDLIVHETNLITNQIDLSEPRTENTNLQPLVNKLKIKTLKNNQKSCVITEVNEQTSSNTDLSVVSENHLNIAVTESLEILNSDKITTVSEIVQPINNLKLKVSKKRRRVRITIKNHLSEPVINTDNTQSDLTSEQYTLNNEDKIDGTKLILNTNFDDSLPVTSIDTQSEMINEVKKQLKKVNKRRKPQTKIIINNLNMEQNNGLIPEVYENKPESKRKIKNPKDCRENTKNLDHLEKLILNSQDTIEDAINIPLHDKSLVNNFKLNLQLENEPVFTELEDKPIENNEIVLNHLASDSEDELPLSLLVKTQNDSIDSDDKTNTNITSEELDSNKLDIENNEDKLEEDKNILEEIDNRKKLEAELSIIPQIETDEISFNSSVPLNEKPEENVLITPEPLSKSVDNLFDFLKTPKNKLVNSDFITTPDLADNSLIIKIQKKLKVKYKKPKKVRTRAPPKLNDSETFPCEICNKIFKRKENLYSHKRTLTHIAKLSEIEARESLAKNTENTVVEIEKKDEEEPLEEKGNLNESNDNLIIDEEFSRDSHQFESENLIIDETEEEILTQKSVTNLIPEEIINTPSSNIELVDIINEVIEKPNVIVEIDQNLSSHTNYEPKRYKSLGERKSFDSDCGIDSFKPIENTLTTQISLLENIIEETNQINYVEDTTSLSSREFDESTEQIIPEKIFQPSEYHPETNKPQIKFSHDTDVLNYMKPKVSESVTQYDDISQPQLEDKDVENPSKDKTRKILNRDEELFLECCSLLKSSSEISGVSKKSTKHIPLNNFQSNSRYIQRDSYSWLAQNSRVNTPLGEPFVNNDWSNSNSAVSSEWLAQKAQSPDRPTENNTGKKCNNNEVVKYSEIQFEDISIDSSMEGSKTLMAADCSSTDNLPLDFHHVDFLEKNTTKPPKSDKIEEFNNVFEPEIFEQILYTPNDEEEKQKATRFDINLRKKFVSALLAQSLENGLQNHTTSRKDKKSRSKKLESTSSQQSIIDYTVPLKKTKLELADSDSSLDCPKKFVTKGAMKVFEGLKVSIPTQDLNLKEVLSCTKPTLDAELDVLENKVLDKIEIVQKPKNNKVKNGKIKHTFGNKLGLKETKKRHRSVAKPKVQPVVEKQPHDVYDFEESVDGNFTFNNGTFPLFRTRDNTSEKPEDQNIIDDNKNNTDTSKWNVESDSDTDRYYDSMSFEDVSVSSDTHESSIGKKIKPTTKRISEKSKEKKCMIMGRIFKNASKPKLEDKIPEIRDFSSEENSNVMENYLDNCNSIDNVLIEALPPAANNITVINSKNKMSKKEMDLLFDKLLEGEKKIEEPTTPVIDGKHEEIPAGIHLLEDTTTEKKKCKGKANKAKKRHRHNSGDSASSEDYVLHGRNSKTKKHNKTPRKPSKPKKESGINLEQEMKECIGVAGRKSQRKCTSGKQNVLAEFWSSDDSNFEELLLQTEKIPLENTEIKETPTVEDNINIENLEEVKNPMIEEEEEEVQNNFDVYNFNFDLEPVESSTKPETSSEFINVSKIKIPKRNSKPKLPRNRKHSKPPHDENEETDYETDKNKRKEQRRKRMLEDGVKSTDCLAVTRRKRNAADMLYYWSSSSDDEFQDLIEVKPIREDTDDDRPMQHGWIVGDSPKKLVTMLAQAKGKKIDGETVKEQKRNRVTL